MWEQQFTMESEDSTNEEGVSMKLLSNKGEILDYKSDENISDTYEYRELNEKLQLEHVKVWRSFPIC